jgi:hypothetical protein
VPKFTNNSSHHAGIFALFLHFANVQFAVFCTNFVDLFGNSWYICRSNNRWLAIITADWCGDTKKLYRVTVQDRDKKAVFCGGKTAFAFLCTQAHKES